MTHTFKQPFSVHPGAAQGASSPPTAQASANRRQWLQAALGSAALGTASMWATPAAWAQSRRATGTDSDGRLVVVFLRGAYDGLSALVPHGDDHYYTLRPTIAIPRPNGTPQSAIALDATFGLHPALAPLLPLWQSGVLGVIPSAGSPDPTRSHFDAQHHWETGIPGKSSSADGWMNTLAGLRAAPSATSTASSTRAPAMAIGVGEANPLILAGNAPVQLVPRGEAATRQGALGDTRTHDAVMKLYAGNDALSRSFRAGADSRMQTAETLKMESESLAMQATAGETMDDPVMRAANNGAGAAKGLLLDARHLGTLMRQNRRLTLGFLSAGGWDTHANQGNATGALANNLANLAAALVQLRRDFSQANDVVLVCSEFGRTSAENGTRGTDHGHGNALWLMGNRVQGGRWHGRWTGLANDKLNQGRDLPVHHDFRAVLAQVLRATQGVAAKELDVLLPGFAWDAELDEVMRAFY
jgi:uncharacterized protein (DUF1501 family)